MDFLRMVAQILKFLVLALLFSLNSCLLVGPDYKEPAKKVAEHWSLEDKSVREAPINNANWWEQFKDPTLSCLMKQGYHNNINLQAVAARVLKARAILAQSVGKLYPQKQDMTGNLIYQKIGGQDLQLVLPQLFLVRLRLGKWIFGVSIGAKFWQIMQVFYLHMPHMIML